MEYKVVESEPRTATSSSFDVPSKSIPVSQIKTPTKQHIQIVALKPSPLKQQLTAGGSHLVNAIQQRIPVTAVPVSLQQGHVQPAQVVYYTTSASTEGQPSRFTMQPGQKSISFQARLPSGPTITLTRPAVVSTTPLIALTPSQLVAPSSGQFVVSQSSQQLTPANMQRTVSALQGHPGQTTWKSAGTHWSPPNHQLMAAQQHQQTQITTTIDVDADDSQSQQKLNNGDGSKKPCHCNKSQCLKLYCECFAAGEFCSGCNCQNCANNLEHEDERNKAIKQCLERNPAAFHPKIMKSMAGKELIGERRQSRGCNCKRSGCWKNYCECYEAKVACTPACKCVGCRNCPEAQRGNLSALNISSSSDPLGPVSHVSAHSNSGAVNHRTSQQTHVGTLYDRQLNKQLAQKSRLAIHHNYQRQPTQTSGIKLPHKLFTPEVIEATCACLLAVADETSEANVAKTSAGCGSESPSPVFVERAVLEEFGRCLAQIIEVAYRPITSGPPGGAAATSTNNSS